MKMGIFILLTIGCLHVAANSINDSPKSTTLQLNSNNTQNKTSTYFVDTQLNQTSNSTSSNSTTWTIFSNIYKYSIIVVVSLLMFSSGCRMSITDVRSKRKSWLSMLITFFVHLIIIPSLAIALIKILRLSLAESLGLFALSISPIGTSGVVYTEGLNGDEQLSLVITFLNTLSFMITVIFYLPMFALLFNNDEITQDLNDIKGPVIRVSVTILVIAICCFIGMILRRFNRKAAEYISKKGRLFRPVFIVYIVSYGLILYWRIFKDTNITLMIILVISPVICSLIGYGISKLARRDKPESRSVLAMTACKNTGHAIIICQSILDSEKLEKAISSPIIFSIAMSLWLGIYVTIFRLKESRKHTPKRAANSIAYNNENVRITKITQY